MNILVTGGCGYIGSHTCVNLIEEGHDVIILDNLSNSKAEVVDKIFEICGKKPVFYKGDMCNKEDVEAVFENHKIDAVIHFAGLKAVGESVTMPLEYYYTNIMGTINICNAMRKYDVKRLIFSSSATVYKETEDLPIKESAPLGCSNPYGRTKLHIEEMLRDLYVSDDSFSIVLLRYFNPVGAHESALIGENPLDMPNNLMPYVARVATGEYPVLRVFGNDYPTSDGTGVRDYIHVTDLAMGHVLALNKIKDQKGIFTYNLGRGCGISVLEMVRAFEKASGKSVPYTVTERRVGDLAAVYADVTLARNELGFVAKKDVDDMCQTAWNYTIKNR